MSFLESPRFPERIGYTTAGGPTFSTDIVQVSSGAEVRNANWSNALMRFDVAHSAKTQAELDVLLSFFRARLGKAEGFRFKDFTDYIVSTANGVLGAGVGTGLPTYQLQKNYTTGAIVHQRKISKPSTSIVYRNASPVTVGASPGNVSIDTTTGIVTFVSDNTQGITNISVGASTSITIAAAQTQLVDGDKVYITGVGGTVGAALNGFAHTIVSKAGSSALTFVISTNTTGLSWTSGGDCLAYPQADEPLTWAGEFDVPVRFDTDTFNASILSRGSGGAMYMLDALPIVELRL